MPDNPKLEVFIDAVRGLFGGGGEPEPTPEPEKPEPSPEPEKPEPTPEKPEEKPEPVEEPKTEPTPEPKKSAFEQVKGSKPANNDPKAVTSANIESGKFTPKELSDLFDAGELDNIIRNGSQRGFVG